MPSIRKIVLACLITIAALGPTQAAVTLGFGPVNTAGSNYQLGLVIAGLGDGTGASVSTFDLTVQFDAGLLAFDGVTFGDPALGDQLDVLGLGGNPQSGNLVSPGSVNVFELSLDTPEDLDSLQANSFTLATLAFHGLAQGNAELNLIVNALGDAYGSPILVNVMGTSVSTVPIAPSIVWMASGVMGLSWLRRRYRSTGVGAVLRNGDFLLSVRRGGAPRNSGI